MTAHPTRSATYPDRETAQWATQQVVTAQRAEDPPLARPAHPRPPRHRGRLALPRGDPVGRVLLQAMMLAGREPVEVRAARVVLKRDAEQPARLRRARNLPDLPVATRIYLP